MWRIVDWQDTFECNRTREIKTMTWVAFPNKHDGDGYCALLDHPDGAAHYGAWCALVQVASKCDPRGTLVRDTIRPHTFATLARITRMPMQVLIDAIARLTSDDIKWLETIPDPVVISEVRDTPQEPAVKSQEPAPRACARQDSTRQNSTEQDIPPSGVQMAGVRVKRRGPNLKYSPAFEEFWSVYPRQSAKADAAKAFEQASQTTAVSLLIAKAAEFAKSHAGNLGRYCPHPASWLNSRRWEDDPATWNANGKPQQTIDSIPEFEPTP